MSDGIDGIKTKALCDELREKISISAKTTATEGKAAASFVCSSGVLMWGQLDCILEARLAEKKKDLKYDGMLGDRKTKNPGTVYSVTHHYKCRAQVGNWMKYQYRGENKDHGYFHPVLVLCHESHTPKDIVNKAMTVGFSWTPDFGAEVTFINRYDWSWLHKTRFGKYWKGHGNDLFLVDPVWMVEKKLGEEDSDQSDFEEDPYYDEKSQETKDLLGKLQAKHKKDEASKSIQLLDAGGKVCGLLSLEFTEDSEADLEWTYGRLVFDTNRQLIGFCAWNGLEDHDDFENLVNVKD